MGLPYPTHMYGIYLNPGIVKIVIAITAKLIQPQMDSKDIVFYLWYTVPHLELLQFHEMITV